MYDFIKIVKELNDGWYSKSNALYKYPEVKFKYITDGYVDAITFNDDCIYHSENAIDFEDCTNEIEFKNMILKLTKSFLLDMVAINDFWEMYKR